MNTSLLVCQIPAPGFAFAQHEHERAAFLRHISCADVAKVALLYGENESLRLLQAFRDLSTSPITDEYGVRQLYGALSLIRCARRNYKGEALVIDFANGREPEPGTAAGRKNKAMAQALKGGRA